MSEEQRKNPRYDSLNLSYVCEDANGVVLQEGMGRTLNISENGILLETTCHNTPNNTLTLEVALEDDIIHVRGKIIHCHEGQKGLYKTGIFFLEHDADDLSVLKRFISIFKGKEG